MQFNFKKKKAKEAQTKREQNQFLLMDVASGKNIINEQQPAEDTAVIFFLKNRKLRHLCIHYTGSFDKCFPVEFNFLFKL